MIKLEYDGLSGMKSELQGFRDLSAFRHFEIGVFELFLGRTYASVVRGVLYLGRGKIKWGLHQR